MSDYTQFAQSNPGTDYPVKDALLRAQLSLDTDKVDSAAVGYSFGYKRNTTSGLNVGYYGGIIYSGGTLTAIADGTVALTASQTNYVERTSAGVVSKNTSGFTATSIPMFVAVTDTTDVTSVTDKRQANVFGDLAAIGNIEIYGSMSGKAKFSVDATAATVSLDKALSVAGKGAFVSGSGNGLTLTGENGSPNYIHIDSTANPGGKLWRVGYSGGAGSSAATLDIYNQTDAVNVGVFSSAGLAVTGAGSFTTTGATEGLAVSTASGGCLVLNETATGLFGHIQFKRSGTIYGYAGLNAGNNLSLMDSAATERVSISTSGAVVTGTLSATGNLTWSGGPPSPAGVASANGLTHSSTAWAFGVGNSNASTPRGIGVMYTAAAPNGTGSEFFYAVDNSTLRIALMSNGGVANYQANDLNLSDRFMKPVFEQYTEAQLDAFGAALDTVDWGRYKLHDQTHGDWNHGPTAQGVRAAFGQIAPELVDEWQPDQQGIFNIRPLSIYTHDLNNIAIPALLHRMRKIENRLAQAGY